jgi:cell division protein FtsL
MAPPATGAARRATAAPPPRPSIRRPALRIFEPQPRRTARRQLSRRGHLWLAALLVVGSLLAVVVGDTMVAQGQVRLADLQSHITSELATQKAAQTEVAQLAAPDRVVAQGILLGLTAPAQVVDLPQVPLNVPLPVPDTTPLPAAHPAPTATVAHAAPTTTHLTPTTTPTTAATATTAPPR